MSIRRSWRQTHDSRSVSGSSAATHQTMAILDDRAEALEETETVAASDEDDFHDYDLLALGPDEVQVHPYVGQATRSSANRPRRNSGSSGISWHAS